MAENKKISQEEVKHIAQLARIELTQEEIEQFSQQLSDVLGYIEQLQEVDTNNVKPISQVTGQVNVFREDAVIDSSDETKKIMSENYPDKQDGYIRVKQIL